jgi:phosphoglycolate phosphatase
MNKTIIWDWNSTLLNDFKYINEASNFLLYYFGHEMVTPKEHRERRPEGVINVLVQSGMTLDFIKQNSFLVQEKYQAYQKELSKNAHLRYGAKQVLNWANDNGYLNIIVSNHHIDEILHHVQRLNLPIEPSLIYANGSHFNKPKKEEIFLKAIDGKNINFQKSFMVGDGIEELQIANKYNMGLFWISGGDFNKVDVQQYNPIFITNLTQIIEVLSK